MTNGRTLVAILKAHIESNTELHSDCLSIAHHLRIAAEHYDQNASLLRLESAGVKDPDQSREVTHLDRLVTQFEHQARECRALASALDEL
jgi:hypothetical protein